MAPKQTPACATEHKKTFCYFARPLLYTDKLQKYKKDLAKTGAFVKFLSIEPLLDSLTSLPLQNMDWVIVGGESGPKARPMKEEWVLNILEQCKRKNVPFFFKQWGGVNKKKAGRLLQGKTWSEMPQAVNVLAEAV